MGSRAWAACPFHFLLGRVLGVAGTEDVEDERWWQIDAAERGSLIHKILERFFREVAASGRPEPGAAYGPEDVQRMEAIAAEEFESAAARGVIGHPLVWDNQRAVILADLRTLLQRDAEQRGAGGWRPAHLEQGFGWGEAGWPPVTISLPDGRGVVLRGFIDRVDRAEGAFRVIDYKTGPGTEDRGERGQPAGWRPRRPARALRAGDPRSGEGGGASGAGGECAVLVLHHTRELPPAADGGRRRH